MGTLMPARMHDTSMTEYLFVQWFDDNQIDTFKYEQQFIYDHEDALEFIKQFHWEDNCVYYWRELLQEMDDEAQSIHRMTDEQVEARLAEMLADGQLKAYHLTQEKNDGDDSEYAEEVAVAETRVVSVNDSRAIRKPEKKPKLKKAQEQKPAATPVTPLSKDRSQIVSIEILDGNDNVISGYGAQYVNLSKDQKWVDGEMVSSKDRCSQKLRIKIKFNKPGSHLFKVKMMPDVGNVQYTDSEKSRNSNFKYQTVERSYSTESNGSKIIDGDFFVTPAGGDKFYLIAEDNFGVKVQSATIETMRMVYCQEVKMRGLTSIASSLGTFKSEFANNGIYMKSLPAIEMEYIPNISTGDQEPFKQKVREVYAGSAATQKEPQTVVIGYTDQLAVKDSDKRAMAKNVKVGTGCKSIELTFETGGAPDFLWRNIVPGEGWYIIAAFLKKGGKYGMDEIVIPEDKCIAIPYAPGYQHISNKVSIDVSWLPAGEGEVVLYANLVNRMRAGLSFGGGNLICVCTRAWWSDISSNEQNQTIIHEAGHKCGMVVDGRGNLPDQVPAHYSGKGHIGGHCHSGLAPNLRSYAGVSGSSCVMFGETNGISSFCTDCSDSLKKVDINNGWQRL